MSIVDKNGDEIKSFQTRIAPSHKPINPDKLPKRPVEKMPNFMQMDEMERLAMMCAALKLKYDPLRYRTEPTYKAKVDSVLMTGMIAMMTDYLRKNGTNIEAVFKEGRIEVI